MDFTSPFSRPNTPVSAQPNLTLYDYTTLCLSRAAREECHGFEFLFMDTTIPMKDLQVRQLLCVNPRAINWDKVSSMQMTDEQLSKLKHRLNWTIVSKNISAKSALNFKEYVVCEYILGEGHPTTLEKPADSELELSEHYFLCESV